jgi:hypothetical protein
MRKLLAVIVGLLIPTCVVGILLAQTSETFTAFMNGTPALSSLTGLEPVPCLSGGVTKQCTAQSIANLATPSSGVTKFNNRTGAVVAQTGDYSASQVTGALVNTNNLSDVQSIASALANLGIGTAGLLNTGTSGNAICTASGACTYSNQQSSTATSSFTGNIVVPPLITSTTSTMQGNIPELCLDTTSASFTTTMPRNPVNGQVVLFVDCKRKFGNFPAWLAPNAGQTFFGGTSFELTSTGAALAVKYYSITTDWVPR